jgi:hypothetical protein
VKLSKKLSKSVHSFHLTLFSFFSFQVFYQIFSPHQPSSISFHFHSMKERKSRPIWNQQRSFITTTTTTTRFRIEEITDTADYSTRQTDRRRSGDLSLSFCFVRLISTLIQLKNLHFIIALRDAGREGRI